MSDDWLWWTASDLGRGIAAGDIDPVALTETYLGAIEAHAQSPLIYARTTPDRARAEARAAADRARSGQRRSLLDGVPISWKDLFDTAGVATEAGSALLKGRVPAQDARVLARATRAGLVCLGKTHLSELAFSGLGINPITATAPNRNFPGGAPGGSSSGAAASVAHGLAAAGIGSDTGGSVRNPAAWNDLVGLKTTHGRLPLDGVVPLIASLDTAGPLCRSVEDAAHLDAAMAAASPPDLRGASLQGARLMVLTTTVLDDLDDAPAAAFSDAVKRLEAAGAQVIRQPLDWLPEMLDLSVTIYSGEAYGTWAKEIEAQPDLMYSDILARFRMGRSVSSAAFVDAWNRIRAYRRRWRQETASFDAVLSPTVPILPPVIERLSRDPEYYARINLLGLRNTRIGNLLGLCGLTLPTGTPSAGLQLDAAPGADMRLLRLGYAAERALS